MSRQSVGVLQPIQPSSLALEYRPHIGHLRPPSVAIHVPMLISCFRRGLTMRCSEPGGVVSVVFMPLVAGSLSLSR